MRLGREPRAINNAPEKRFAAEWLQPGQPCAWVLNFTESGGLFCVPRVADPSVALLRDDMFCDAA